MKGMAKAKTVPPRTNLPPVTSLEKTVEDIIKKGKQWTDTDFLPVLGSLFNEDSDYEAVLGQGMERL